MIGGSCYGNGEFNVPDDVKKKFDKAFAGENKSRVIAELMVQAIEEQHIQRRRSKAIDALLARRRTKRPVQAKQIRPAREAGPV